ncbi:FimV family protein [Bordetella genomosp. 13]|uniref:type IV pilus assembly protein FimV n=1 Tax=Bordetella genomosp. 13 TaxID=463040 RepID=UPI0011A24211|nr:FimV/HubP family polar landmark protein [Bordetella genomosp. 13]
MTPHPRGLHHAPRNKALGLALALAIGASACVDAQAARAGHARVVSSPGEPMRIEVPLLDLTADEAASLQVQLADAAAWQRAGLQPPAPLADTRVTLEGSGAARRLVRISASQPITTPTIDVLLDLRSGAGQRQMQVTLLVPARDAEAGVRRAAVQPAAAASGSAQPARRVDDVTVRPGQTLSGIAARNAVADASIYQMLVALWQANPQAFIQNNMNLVRAGETLTIPDAATVRAIDPAEARRIFVEQAAAYERYRARLGAAAGAGAAVPRADGSSGQVDGAGNARAAAQPPAQDRLRLSNAGAAGGASPDAAGDVRASEQRAMSDARQRVDTLQSNVDALNRAAAGQGGAAGGQGAGSGSQGAGAAGGGQGGSASGAPNQGGAAQASSNGAASGSAGAGAAAGSAAGAAAGIAAAGGSAAGGGGASMGANGAAAGGNAAGATGAQAGNAAGVNGAAAGGNAVGGAFPATGGNAPVSNGAAAGSAAAGAGGAAAGSNAAGATGVAGDNSAGINGAGNAATSSNNAVSSGTAANGAGAATVGPAGASSAAGGTAAAPQAGAGGAAAGTPSASAPGVAAGAQSGADAAARAKDGMPSWLADNLLAVVTAVLALLIFIVAWMLRRAGARRNEDVEEVDYGDPPPFDSRAFNRKLDAIDLDLNHPPTDEPKPTQDNAPSATPSYGTRT